MAKRYSQITGTIETHWSLFTMVRDNWGWAVTALGLSGAGGYLGWAWQTAMQAHWALKALVVLSAVMVCVFVVTGVRAFLTLQRRNVPGEEPSSTLVPTAPENLAFDKLHVRWVPQENHSFHVVHLTATAKAKARDVILHGRFATLMYTMTDPEWLWSGTKVQVQRDVVAKGEVIDIPLFQRGSQDDLALTVKDEVIVFDSFIKAPVNDGDKEGFLILVEATLSFGDIQISVRKCFQLRKIAGHVLTDIIDTDTDAFGAIRDSVHSR